MLVSSSRPFPFPRSPPVSTATQRSAGPAHAGWPYPIVRVLNGTLLLATCERHATQTSWGFQRGLCVTTVRGTPATPTRCRRHSNFSHGLPPPPATDLSVLGEPSAHGRDVGHASFCSSHLTLHCHWGPECRSQGEAAMALPGARGPSRAQSL